MRKKNIMRVLSVLILLAMTLTTCRDRIEPEADDFVEYGWTLYTNRDYVGAFEQFQVGLDDDSLYIDGYNGMGWCYIEQGNPDSALIWFTDGLDYITIDSSQVRFEMLAGAAFSHHILENYYQVIVHAADLYALNPIFEFSHNFRINYRDIVIVLAASHYALGEFTDALDWVQELDADFTVDVSTPGGRAQLATKIETLQNL